MLISYKKVVVNADNLRSYLVKVVCFVILSNEENFCGVVFVKAQGLFIAVEGGEGVGKTSFVSMLQQRLQTKTTAKLVVTREPGGTPLADRIRDLFVNPPSSDAIAAMTELLLVNAARAQHVSMKLKPALSRGEVVICDRFADSSRVYQGVLGGIDRNALEKVIDLACQGITPDVVFLLDCDPKISLERLNKRLKIGGDVSSRFDLAEYEVHEKLRNAFLQIAAERSKVFCILDAAMPTEDLVVEALKYLEKHFKI